jgi:hypothetical protein
MINKEPPDTER